MKKIQLVNCTESHIINHIFGRERALQMEIPFCKAVGSSNVKHKRVIACWRLATLVSSPRNEPD